MNKKDKEKIIGTMGTAIAVVVLFAVLLICGDKALDALEQVECYKLQANAERYENFLYSPTNQGGFYITSLEKQMCDYHGIVIDAPVR
jgi:hypothetical protein